jgi:amidohydrolase
MTDGLSAEWLAEAVGWRHHLHAHPELAFHEQHTADFIASRLSEFGLSVHRGLGGTGVVGTLSRGTSRRSLAIRADMDALPIQEMTGVPHASAHPGMMHACGHDGHVAMALAAARVCAHSTEIDGTAHFIFQPAEENEGGAQRMVRDGLFKQFPVDSIYALHNWPALALGSCAAREGPMMAAFGTFEITITGRGCHGAMPQEGADTVLAGCQVVSALHTIVSRNVEPMASAVVSATQIHAGDTWNVLPGICTIRGTTRWFDHEVGELLERRIRELAGAVAMGFDCEVDIRYERRYPATINDREATIRVRDAAKGPAVKLALVDAHPSLGAEDFSFMLQEVPGCYLWLGTGRKGGDFGLHSPRYDFNDDALPLGVALWVSLVHEVLNC